MVSTYTDVGDAHFCIRGPTNSYGTQSVEIQDMDRLDSLEGYRF